jgi:hypothetical protein
MWHAPARARFRPRYSHGPHASVERAIGTPATAEHAGSDQAYDHQPQRLGRPPSRSPVRWHDIPRAAAVEVQSLFTPH